MGGGELTNWRKTSVSGGGTYLRVNDISKFLSLSFLVFYWFMQEN